MPHVPPIWVDRTIDDLNGSDDYAVGEVPGFFAHFSVCLRVISKTCVNINAVTSIGFHTSIFKFLYAKHDLFSKGLVYAKSAVENFRI